jgi:hypothetical protein
MIETAIQWATDNLFYVFLGAFIIYMIVQVIRGSYSRGESPHENPMIDGGNRHHSWSSGDDNSSDGGGGGGGD